MVKQKPQSANNATKSWLGNNLFNILSAFVIAFSTIIYIQADVEVNAKDIMRMGTAIIKIEEKVDSYPSELFFTERFGNTDKAIENLEKAVRELEKSSVR